MKHEFEPVKHPSISNLAKKINIFDPIKQKNLEIKWKIIECFFFAAFKKKLNQNVANQKCNI